MPVCDHRWLQSTGGRADESARCRPGPATDIQEARHNRQWRSRTVTILSRRYDTSTSSADTGCIVQTADVDMQSDTIYRIDYTCTATLCCMALQS